MQSAAATRVALPVANNVSSFDYARAHALCVEKARRNIVRLADRPVSGAFAADGNYFACPEGFFDIGNWTSKYWFPGLPWDHAEHYEKRSLLSVVKNVKTPTMVLTGEEDWRTPMSDSEQYYQALKLLGVESVLVRVPGEPHGIQVRPSHHISKVAHIAGWFDAHLN